MRPEPSELSAEPLDGPHTTVERKFADRKRFNQILGITEIAVSARIPSAIGRSKLAPSLRTSRGQLMCFLDGKKKRS